MVYKWQYDYPSKQEGKKAIKPGVGRKPLYPMIESQTHQLALQSMRDGICVTLAGIAQSMRNALDDPLFKASSIQYDLKWRTISNI
jgi:hypothetical protein